jgi:hypothetical protein
MRDAYVRQQRNLKCRAGCEPVERQHEGLGEPRTTS